MKRKIIKSTSIFLLINFLLEFFAPSVAWALTSGPTQPEVSSFQEVGSSDLVDLFSGDFSYNIPLLDVDGYPVNIAYNSGISMDQEASWVGLGWNINPGVVNRNMRGIPDDFAGDPIHKERYQKANTTYGLIGSKSYELAEFELDVDKFNGSLNSSVGIDLSYNNYKGIGIENFASLTLSIALGKNSKTNSNKNSLAIGLQKSSSKDKGLSITPSVAYQRNVGQKSKFELGGSFTFNSTQGLVQYGLNPSISGSKGDSKYTSNGGGLNGKFNIGAPTYFPQAEFPRENFGIGLSVKFGTGFFSADELTNIKGYGSSDYLRDNVLDYSSYGYLNNHKANRNKTALLDLNKEKESQYSQNAPMLHITNHTYDIFAVSGHGVSGSFRPHTSEIGILGDPSVESHALNNISVGVDIASGNLVKWGADVAMIWSDSKNERWQQDNPADNFYRFSGTSSKIDYEPVYFKQIGDMSVDEDDQYFNKFGNTSPVRIGLNKASNSHTNGSNLRLESADSQTPLQVERTVRQKRKKRNQVFSYLSIDEAKNFGVQKDLYTSPDKVYTTNNGHHIGEISVLKDDGSRYVYGIPVYNKLHKEVSFSVGKSGTYSDPLSPNAKGEVVCTQEDASSNNKRNTDHNYNKTEIPAYAHSFLITAILSPDYVDVDGIEGPSDGDMGSYTLFNYDKKVPEFKWRTPLATNTSGSNSSNYLAAVELGLLSKDDDDMGSYVYGVKEVWYLSSIETKNSKAIFSVSVRLDGRGVTGENGFVESNSANLFKLDNIKLYSKKDLTTPLKSVYFEYDYSLCPNVTNNINTNITGTISNSSSLSTYQNYIPGTGKLTLKKIFFTYQESQRERFSPYEFVYNRQVTTGGTTSSANNYDYSPKAIDRWGVYKPTSYFKDNIYFPYTNQTDNSIDDYASAWSLTEIQLPSGGKINVKYESDDYAYVQDKVAMQMVKVDGFSSDGSSPEEDLSNTEYIHVTLPEELYKDDQQLTSDEKKREFINKYIRDIDYLYFRICVNLNRGGLLQSSLLYKDRYEIITGYCKINKNNIVIKSKNTVAFKLDKVETGSNSANKVNPVRVAAANFCRLYTPDIQKDSYGITESGSILDGIASLGSILGGNEIKGLIQSFQSPNGAILSQGKCKEIDPDKSYVRLYSHNLKKKGGGLRVSQIQTSDAASAMGIKMNTIENVYTQQFTYTKRIKDASGQEIEISSGVAAYEPGVGGEENPFKEPIAYSQNAKDNILVPNERYFLEKPYGESFAPAPSVGYSKVTVKNLNSSSSTNSKYRGTGSIENEFYTFQDFPMKVRNTDISAKPVSPWLFKLLKVYTVTQLDASQGFSIELNDMNGKPKSKTVKDEFGSKISSVNYIYKTDDKGNLDNLVKVVNPDGTIEKRNVGVDVDFSIDSQSFEDNTYSSEVHWNVESFNVALPFIIGLALGAYNKNQVRVRTIATTKVIYRMGLLEKVVAEEFNSKVTTQNELYDAETGSVLLTSVGNEFKTDKLYNMKYPSYWAYDGMGPAYKNLGLKFNVTIKNGSFDISPNSSLYNLLCSGDEMISDDNAKIYITDINTLTSGTKRITVRGGKIVADRGAGVPSGKQTLKIIRSGRRNLSGIAIMNVSTLNDNPIVNNRLSNYVGLKILNASANQFSDVWDVNCKGLSTVNSTVNPYYEGSKGIWRLQSSWAYLTNRNQQSVNGRRTDGYFTFTPLWQFNVGASAMVANTNNWKKASEITRYDPYNGMDFQHKDALGINSAALFGYKHNKVTGMGSNAQSTDLFFDNFEDYDMKSSVEDLNTFKNGTITTSMVPANTKSHSGRKSLKVPKGSTNKIFMQSQSECQSVSSSTDPCSK